MMFIISVLSFGAINLAPSSMFGAGDLNPNMTQEAVTKLQAIYGLDKPLLEQYLSWLRNLVELNFGVSFVSGEDVLEEISKRIPITLIMNFVTLIIVFIISLYLGIKAALNLNKSLDKFISQLALFSFATPSFYLSLLLILFFSLYLEWFPIVGIHSIDVEGGFSYYLDMAWHLVLPISVMIFVSFGSMVVYIRSLSVEIIKSDYYYFAKARDLSDRVLLFRYILPNLMPPIVTLLGLSLPGLIGGSVILEAIFGIEGMGQLFFMSAMSRDYPVIMGILMISAFLTLLGNMFADLILLKLNPYMKRGN